MTAAVVAEGRAVLGIELGSTRIKACLVDPDGRTLATADAQWENQLVDGLWTYRQEAVWQGVRAAVAGVLIDAEQRFGAALTAVAALGVSAMMHGYLALDRRGELLVPFRTWRNTNTSQAAAELTAAFGVNIPLRWSVAHVLQAVLDEEPHLEELGALTTLAGYVHEALTGERVLGVGDASGMFPIDEAAGDYDAGMLGTFDEIVAARRSFPPLGQLLPRVLVAGQPAGVLTEAGARLLDPTGQLLAGAVLCPPEGDAGTGMVATNAVTPGTANISVGTSVFAMVVLDRTLEGIHEEVDLVTTPAGTAVAMVHCNNGADELAAWADLFTAFSTAVGFNVSRDEIFSAVLREAVKGEADAGGVTVHPFLSGEPVAGLVNARPLLVRAPGARFTLANLARAHVYGLFGTLALGLQVLARSGVQVDSVFAHGGLFRTPGPAQRLLAATLDAPVTVGTLPGEGGAWGIALLARYLEHAAAVDLPTYLATRVFAGTESNTVVPDPADVAGFAAYLEQFVLALAAQRALTRVGRTNT